MAPRRAAPPPLPAPNTPEAKALTEAFEAELQSLPALLSHRKSTNEDDWYEVRPYDIIPEDRRPDLLITGPLYAPGRLTILPLMRARYDESEMLVFVHLGRSLCGYDGIIHGGILVTVLDEAMGRSAIMNFPGNIGVTAKLEVKYRAPLKPDNWVVIHTKRPEQPPPSKSNPRLTLTSSVFEASTGTLLAEAEGLFIQPRLAKL